MIVNPIFQFPRARRLRSIRPAQLPQPLVDPEAALRGALLFTRHMGKYFGMSISPFLYDNVLISFLIDRLLAVFAEYNFGHLKALLICHFNRDPCKSLYPHPQRHLSTISGARWEPHIKKRPAVSTDSLLERGEFEPAVSSD